uniref:Uncharacterized protein n=1 Tax=Peronospora matthiolae TaxID=2874970 RepID=A0AAV1UC88_9STRA
MSSPSPGAPATAPSTGTACRDDVAAGGVQHSAVNPLPLHRDQVVVGESRRFVEELVHAVHGLRDRVARIGGQPNLFLRVPRLVA